MKSCDNPYLVHFGILNGDAPVMQTCPEMENKRDYLNFEMLFLMSGYAELERLYNMAKRVHSKESLASYREKYTAYTEFMDNLQDEIDKFLKSPNACQRMTVDGNHFKEQFDKKDEQLKYLEHPDHLEEDDLSEMIEKTKDHLTTLYKNRNSVHIILEKSDNPMHQLMVNEFKDLANNIETLESRKVDKNIIKELTDSFQKLANVMSDVYNFG